MENPACALVEKKFVAAFPGAAEGQLTRRDEGGRGEGNSRAEVTWGCCPSHGGQGQMSMF